MPGCSRGVALGGDCRGDPRGAAGGNLRFDPRCPFPRGGRGVVHQAALVQAHAVPNGREPLWDRVEAGARGRGALGVIP